MAQIWLLISVLTFTILQLFISGVLSTTFTFVNKCDYTVWPGILSNAGIAPLSTTGFSLQTGESKTINPPSSWGGRLWGRTLCTQDSTGKFTCVTGDCGSGQLECAGGNAAPPATLAEFTLDGSGGLDFYDVSLVDGYNLPMLVVPQGGTGVNCTTTGCEVDLNGACPSELKVTSSEGESVACKSACEAFGQEQYCCSGAYGTPDTCKPSSYSELFKSACPSAYSYAYDDKTSTFTCAGADYLITFCPSPNTRIREGRRRNRRRKRRRKKKRRQGRRSAELDDRRSSTIRRTRRRSAELDDRRGSTIGRTRRSEARPECTGPSVCVSPSLLSALPPSPFQSREEEEEKKKT